LSDRLCRSLDVIAIEVVADDSELLSLELSHPNAAPALSGVDYGAIHRFEHARLPKACGMPPFLSALLMP